MLQAEVTEGRGCETAHVNNSKRYIDQSLDAITCFPMQSQDELSFATHQASLLAYDHYCFRHINKRVRKELNN